MSEVKKSMARALHGIVVSNKMKDTIVVRIERQIQHPKYGKLIKRSTKVYAQDTGNTCAIGDQVVVRECPPISKTKCWKLEAIRHKAEVADV